MRALSNLSHLTQLDTLYGLYVDVHESIEVDWPQLLWQDVMQEMEFMNIPLKLYLI